MLMIYKRCESFKQKFDIFQKKTLIILPKKMKNSLKLKLFRKGSILTGNLMPVKLKSIKKLDSSLKLCINSSLNVIQ